VVLDWLGRCSPQKEALERRMEGEAKTGKVLTYT
jgi:hypothetical protein